MKHYWFKKAYLESGWASDVSISVSNDGIIQSVTPDSPAGSAELIQSPAIAGLSNTHSHAFQRAMAGLTEVGSDVSKENNSQGDDSQRDNFWSWRNMMYQFASLITPEQQKIIAAQLYMEMQMAGFTNVAEFHYLHNNVSGQHYDPAHTMSLALMQAAKISGIGLTLLPVLYMNSNFDNPELNDEQLRFKNSIASFQHLLSSCKQHIDKNTSNTLRLGAAIHSLRAVPAQAIDEFIAVVNDIDSTMPLHIHIAEQEQEVQECLRAKSKRPVQWLLENHIIDSRWCLVHATHLSPDELKQLACSGATVSLCPTTEANLGDGFFDLPEFLKLNGSIAIGSDSNTSVSPVEELRLLEYGQRLVHQARNIASNSKQKHTAENLLNKVQAGGENALGKKVGKLAVGYYADILVLDDSSAQLHAKPSKYLLDAFIFSGNSNLVRDVMCAGKWVVKNFKHKDQPSITHDYRQAIAQLQAQLS